MKHLIKIKVNFRETLAVVYPNYKKLFSSIYSDDSLTFLKEFPHPSLYTSKLEDRIIEILKINGIIWKVGLLLKLRY